MKKRTALCVCATLVTFLIASQAAAADYICKANYYPFSSVKGEYGYISINYWSGPNCTGTNWGYMYACTKNATSSGCVNLSSYYYNEAQILTLLQSIVSWIPENLSVTLYKSTCNGGVGNCLTTVSFEAD